MEITAQKIMRAADGVFSTTEGWMNREITGLKPYADEQHIRDFSAKLNELIASGGKKDVLLALLGEMSSGKSTLVNNMLGYPLFPVAKIVTSACPVEIRYSEYFKLQIFTYKKEAGRMDEQVIYTFDDPGKLSDQQMEALQQYSRNCAEWKLLVCENMDYYFDNRITKDEGVKMDPADVIQCAQLMMVPLAGYVGQDWKTYSQKRQELVEERSKLLETVFGLENGCAYGVRIWLKSDLLKNGLALVDLPGIGSDVSTHNEITIDYLNRADCCILAFGLSAKVDETEQALRTILDFEAMRTAGKDSRFLAVVNKCDICFEEDEDYYGDAIAQAVQVIKPLIKSINISEILPVSARYAEWRLIDQGGVPADRTLKGKKLARRKKSNAEISGEMKADYHQAFEYTDPISNKLVSCSTAQFMEETVGLYGSRIRFLNSLNRLGKLADEYGVSLSGLEMQRKMIELLRACGDELMKDLLDKMDHALRDTQEDFQTELDNIQREMGDSTTELADTLEKKVCPAYIDGLKEADEVMKNHLSVELEKMDKDFFGHFCIDEADERSRINRSIFLNLHAYFSSFDFNPYLSQGNNLLDKHLAEQRDIYSKGVDRLKKAFKMLQADCKAALDDVYSEFESDSRLAGATQDMKDIYKKCYESAKKSILDYLEKLTKQMSEKMDKDTRVEDELEKTTGEMLAFFNPLIDRYHRVCKQFLDGRQGVSFFKSRPYLEIAKIKKTLGEPFVATEDRGAEVDRIYGVLTRQDEHDSHINRLNRAMDGVHDFLNEEVAVGIRQFRSSIGDSVKNLFGTSANAIRVRYLYLLEIARSMEKTLGEVKNSSEVKEAVAIAEGLEWARADAGEAVRKLGEVREAVRGFILDGEQHYQSLQKDAEEQQYE